MTSVFYIIIYLCVRARTHMHVYLCVCACARHGTHVEVREQLQELVLSSDHVLLGIPLRFGGNCLSTDTESHFTKDYQ